MKTEILKENEIWKSADLALVAVVFLFYPLEAIEKPVGSRKAYFLFKREVGLDELIESYWRRELKVDPQAYAGALRSIKARLYGEE